MVIAILLYCSEVWGPYMLGTITTFELSKNKMFKLTNEIEKSHLKFCKRILGVHSTSTNVAVYAKLGRLPLINSNNFHLNCKTLAKLYGFDFQGISSRRSSPSVYENEFSTSTLC